jgi:hypothetical protein
MLRRKMHEVWDEARVRFSTAPYHILKKLHIPITGLRWFLTAIAPVSVGVYFEVLLGKYISQGIGKLIQTVPTMRISDILPHWPFFLAGVLYLWSLFLQVHKKDRDIRRETLSVVLYWLYSDSGLGENPEADIRCTLWTPRKSDTKPEMLRLEQVVDYEPRMSQRTKTKRNKYRKHKEYGRTMRVARMKGDEVQSIGLIGKCVIDSFQNRKPSIIVERLDEDVDFVDEMTNGWNFTKAEAKRLTQDRRSYIAMALMDTWGTDLLAILYLDSRLPDSLSRELAMEVQKFLPRVGRILTAE